MPAMVERATAQPATAVRRQRLTAYCRQSDNIADTGLRQIAKMA